MLSGLHLQLSASPCLVIKTPRTSGEGNRGLLRQGFSLKSVWKWHSTAWFKLKEAFLIGGVTWKTHRSQSSLAEGSWLCPHEAPISTNCFVIISWLNCILQSHTMSTYHGFHLCMFPLNSSKTNHPLIPCNADLVGSGRLKEIWGSLNILYCYPAEQIKLSNWITSPEPLRCISERWEWHCFGHAVLIQAQPSEKWNIVSLCMKTL